MNTNKKDSNEIFSKTLGLTLILLSVVVAMEFVVDVDRKPFGVVVSEEVVYGEVCGVAPVDCVCPAYVEADVPGGEFSVPVKDKLCEKVKDQTGGDSLVKVDTESGECVITSGGGSTAGCFYYGNGLLNEERSRPTCSSTAPNICGDLQTAVQDHQGAAKRVLGPHLEPFCDCCLENPGGVRCVLRFKNVV